MRILIDARYLDGSFSGIATYSRLLLENLSRIDTGNEYKVVVRPGFHENLELGPNFEVMSWGPKPVSAHTLLRLHAKVEALEPDLMHSFFPLAPVFGRTPLVVTVHDMQPFVDPDFSARRPGPLPQAYNLFYRWAYPAVIRRARWVVCDSYATRDDVAALLPESIPKLVVAPPGLDESLFLRPPDAAVAEVRRRFGLIGPYFLYYGSTRPNKNLPNLVKAFARLKRDSGARFDNARLVLVLKKDRFFRDIQRTIEGKEVAGDVVVLDPLDAPDQRALLAGALAFCLVTKYEGFGFPALEAMATGVPVMAGNNAALPEVCGDSALLVDPDSLDEIEAGMRMLLTDEGARQTLAAAGPRHAASFRWQDTAQRMLDIYSMLM